MTDEPTEASLGNPILNSSRSRSMARTTRSKVDAYIDRSTKWPEVMTRLRPILAGCGLTEEIKWGKPCFSQDRHHIVISGHNCTVCLLILAFDISVVVDHQLCGKSVSVHIMIVADVIL